MLRPAPLLRSLLALALAAATLSAAGQGVQRTYRDPAGRYRVDVPTNWTLRTDGEALRIEGPDGAVVVWLAVIEGGDAELAVAEAWRRVDPRFDAEVQHVLRPPSGERFDEIVSVTYDAGRERVAGASGRRLGERTYVVLVRGERDACLRRQAQVAIVASSFQPSEAPPVSLAGARPERFGPRLGDDLARFVPDAMARAGVPGAVVAVVQDGEVAYLAPFGVKELGRPEPVGAETQMMIGSTGKSLTTLMMAALVDAGAMRWETPVVEVLPSFALADPQRTRELEMRHLVCACTGVPRRDLELLFNARTLSAEDVVASLADVEPFTELGEAFQYSNQMVATGGYLAAVAAGADPRALRPGYAAELQRRVLTPIGMRATTVSFLAVVARGDHASPHGLLLTGERAPLPLEEERLLSPVAPAGGHWSTAPDLARYLVTLLQGGVAPDGTRVVSEAQLARLLEPQVRVRAQLDYGLGWMIGAYRDLRSVSHAGNTFGFTSGLTFLPDHGVGVVVLTNGRATNAFNQTVIRRVLDQLFGLPVAAVDEDLQFALDTRAQALCEIEEQLTELPDPAVLAPWLGTYRHPALGRLELRRGDGALIADVGEFRQHLRRRVVEGEEAWIAIDPPLAGLIYELDRDASGRRSVTLVAPPERYRFVAR
jgi:CubicO group peptidase (beta-lactamase class C family)